MRQIEPLVAADGSRTVLLNRGWVPAEWRVRMRQSLGFAALTSRPSVRTSGGDKKCVLRERHRHRALKVSAALRGCRARTDTHAAQREAIGICACQRRRRLVLGGRACPCCSRKAAQQHLACGGACAARGIVAGHISYGASWMHNRLSHPEAEIHADCQPQAADSLLHFAVTPDDHRNYAAIWFTLAAATGVIAGRAVRSKSSELLARRSAATAGRAR